MSLYWSKAAGSELVAASSFLSSSGHKESHLVQHNPLLVLLESSQIIAGTGDDWDLAMTEILERKMREEGREYSEHALLEEVEMINPPPVGSELAKQGTLEGEPWLGEKPP